MDSPGTRRIKRTLEELAARTDTDRPPYVTIIDEAAAACADLERAAGFVDADGLERLDTAIESAIDDDAPEPAARGRRTRSAYRRFRRAAAGESLDDAGLGDDGSDGSADRETDQFHSAGGTAKRRTAQGSQ
ncbi:hypothetical protein [Halopenitus sp. POP-27]|uniref:hypothetical protein n=1 Tax=Halopenitus sp. POP-27 TaxID=2994425 RepID=UPI0024694AD0|nr:hypothetical protein [Halopenitus sp. POP-27]